MGLQVQSFFDTETWTFSHVVHAGAGTVCAIIDPVLDYDSKAARTTTASADRIIDFVRAQRLELAWILETHAHADHLSAAAYLREQLGGRIGIGAQITTVQQTFAKIFALESTFATDGSQFDRLFGDGETFAIGALTARVLHLPGHTPACVGYAIGDAVFVGDTIFAPDVGTARCDFPGGDAMTLYASIRKLLALPAQTKLYLCHDYPPTERDVVAYATVGEQRAANIHVHDGVEAQAFVAMREARDATLEMPALILPSVQVNIRAGALPPPANNGIRYLHIPLNTL